jgi:hypothetical protein
MLPIRIIPRFRLILHYDVRLDMYEQYYEYVLKEFVPTLQSMELYMVAVWQTVYGDYPARQVDFVAEHLETIRDVLNSDRWQTLETRLKIYTLRYSCRIVRYRNGFQF